MKKETCAIYKLPELLGGDWAFRCDRKMIISDGYKSKEQAEKAHALKHNNIMRNVSQITKKDLAQRKRFDKVRLNPKTRSQKLGFQMKVMDDVNRALKKYGLILMFEKVDKDNEFLFKMYEA